jgi:hypothetical protein
MMAIYNAAVNLKWKVIFRGKEGVEATETSEKNLDLR